MCGQLGYSGTKPFDFEKIKLLILWNSLERGEDATGLYSPLNGHRKSLLKGSTVVSNDEFKLIPDTILMAHVRAKTIGLNTIENTHPFKRGDWYLQHNGTHIHTSPCTCMCICIPKGVWKTQLCTHTCVYVYMVVRSRYLRMHVCMHEIGRAHV